MSDFSYTAPGSIRERSKPSKKIEKSLKRLLVLAAVVLAAELIWLLGISPCIPFSTIEVHGFAGFDRAEILACAGIGENSSFISTNVRDVQARLSAHNLVESAKTTKRFPDRLSILLEGRRPAAVSLAYIGGMQVPLYIDRHGVVFKIGNEKIEGSLPVISGFEFGSSPLGMRFPPSLTPLFENISQIAAASPELLAAVSEIRIEQKAWDRFETVIYPVNSSIKVRFENNLTEDNLRYMLLILEIFRSQTPKPEEIDFRSGVSSYKIKGALSGN